MRSRKNIVKEVFIFIVLLILVLLILAVALYDYVPNNINVAEIKQYNPDSKTTSIKQEIAYTNGGDITEDSTSEEFITALKSYSIDASDLTMYAARGSYTSQNPNPFEYATEPVADNSGTTTDTTGTATNTTSTTSNTTTTSTGTTTSNTTTGTFFESPNSK